MQNAWNRTIFFSDQIIEREKSDERFVSTNFETKTRFLYYILINIYHSRDENCRIMPFSYSKCGWEVVTPIAAKKRVQNNLQCRSAHIWKKPTRIWACAEIFRRLCTIKKYFRLTVPTSSRTSNLNRFFRLFSSRGICLAFCKPLVAIRYGHFIFYIRKYFLWNFPIFIDSF